MKKDLLRYVFSCLESMSLWRVTLCHWFLVLSKIPTPMRSAQRPKLTMWKLPGLAQKQAWLRHSQGVSYSLQNSIFVKHSKMKNQANYASKNRLKSSKRNQKSNIRCSNAYKTSDVRFLVPFRSLESFFWSIVSLVFHFKMFQENRISANILITVDQLRYSVPGSVSSGQV